MSGAARAYFSGADFDGNSSTGYAGVIYATNATAEFNGAEFKNNSAASYGGAVYLTSSSVAAMNNVTTSGNASEKLGGFVYMTASTLDVYNSKINGNTSATNGGALYAATDAVFNAYNTVFANNKSTSNGGALMIYNGGSNSIIHSCTFIENEGDCGGAIYISNKSQVQMYNITANNNSASKGGFMYETTSGTVVHLVGLNVTGNTATTGGPIIWGNTTNAKLYIDKIKYIDNDYNGDWNDEYWASAIYNLLKVYDQVGTVPSYVDYNGQTVEPAVPVSITNVSTAAQLERALQVGYTFIRITGDFELDRTFYVMSDVTIFADEPHTLTRAAGFGGDLFVVGEDEDGKHPTVEIVFTLGKRDGSDAALTVDGNSANMTSDVVGTVVFVCDGARADLGTKLTITNNKKVGNDRLTAKEYRVSYAPRVGGAVAIIENGSELNVWGGIYSNNTVNDITDANTDAGSLSSQGGAFYNHGVMNIYGGTFTGNHAGRGGSLYNYRTLRIYNGTFTKNSSSTLGGVLYTPNSTGAFLYIGDECDEVENPEIYFADNSAESGGGALYLCNFVSIKNAKFEGNSSGTSYGGALYASATRMTITDSEFVKNTTASKHGAAIYLTGNNEREETREMVVIGSVFDQNTAASRAGAVYMSGGARAYFEDTDFTSNTAATGGVFYINGAHIEINGSTISGNSSTTEAGGVFYMLSSATALLNDVTVTNNTAKKSGGLAYYEDATFEIYNSTVSNNTSTTGGGAIYAATGGVLNAYNTSFIGNVSEGNGGALMLYNGGANCIIHSCTFTGNVGNCGGAIYISNKTQAQMYNITANNNSADKGGFMYETTSGTVVKLVGLTVDGNTAVTGGPIIWGNTANAKLQIDKSKYTDLDVSGPYNSTYWKSAIYNKLTHSEITEDIPKYLDYGNEAYDHMADAVDVATADELEQAILSGVKHIRVVADFELDRTFYITGDTTIFTTIGHTLTRAPDFGGDIFVIGEDANGVSSLKKGNNAKLTLGNSLSELENLLVIDGNKDNMTVDVVGTVLFITESATVELYTNVTVQNCHKVNNERTYVERYLLPIENRIGGTLAIIASGTLDIYGGNYKNNSVNEEVDSTENGRISSTGGLIFNVSNLRIFGGLFENNFAGRGGVIYNYRLVRLLGGSFVGNSASASGGVYYSPNSSQVHLYINNPDLTGSPVLFESNTAKSAGAIYASALTANVIYGGATFTGNSATAGSGGAILMYGQLTVRDSVFKNNTASNRGGAIYASKSGNDSPVRYMELTGCTFEGNEATLGGALSYYSGGADFDQGAVANINDCTFKNNVASLEIGGASSALGGAIFTERRVTLNVKNSSFTGNKSATEGGAIYLAGESVATVSGSTIKNNSSGKYGGAIVVRSSYLDIIDTDIISNTAINNGGAIYVSYQSNRDINSKVSITGSLFKSNSTDANGGAIYATRRDIKDEWNILTVTDTTFENNSAGKNGGATYTLANVGIYMENVIFQNNVATASESGSGGAMYVYGSKLEINGAQFNNNAATDVGGALLLDSSTKAILNNVTTSGNTGYSGAFANLTDGASLTLFNSSVSNNTAEFNGGAIYVSTNATLEAYGTQFNSNAASENGGALMIYNGGSKVILQDCTFDGNTADKLGGGMYISNKSKVDMYNITGTNNSANKGGFMYETTSGTVVNIAGLTVSGNTATTGGAIIWGNTLNAKLFIDKSQYVDSDVTGALDDAYWSEAIYNLLTVEDTEISIPTAKTYVHKAPTVTPPAKKPVVSVDHIFELAQNSSDGYINSTYDKFPVLDNSSNFMSDGTTYFENINGGTVSVDSFVYDTYAKDGNVNVGQGLLIYQAMLYKQAHPDEEVSIAASSYRFSIEAALNINRDSRYFGYMRNLYGMDYDEFGFVRLSYLLVSAAKMGINVTVIGHIDGYPINSSDPNLYEYFTGHLDTPCDPAYTDGVVGDYLNFAQCYWTLDQKGGTDMMHNKMCAVSHYLDMNGVEHRNAVFSSSANLDGISSKGYNGNWKLQTATIVSDHADIYRVAMNYLNLLAEYSAQEAIYEFQDIMATTGAEQIDLILAGQGNLIPADEQLVYLGSETDDVFELYFTPFAGGTAVWDEKYNPYTKYIREMYESEGSIIFTWNAAEYNSEFPLGKQMEEMIAGSFHNNKNVENKFYGNMENFNKSLMDGLVVGKDIGYLSINKLPYGEVHNKDIMLSYVKDGQRYYVSLLNSCNMHSGSMCYQSNFMLVIKETDCDEDSVFFTMNDLSTTGIVEHTYGEEQAYLPEDGSHGYYYTPCLYCDKKIISGTIHRPGDWIVDIEPTPAVNGIQHKECNVCGCVVEMMEIIVKETEHQKVDEHVKGTIFDYKSKLDTGISKTPLTLEAVIQLSPDVNERGGVIIGNYSSDNQNVINLEVYNQGKLRLYIKNNGIVNDCVFDTDVRAKSPIHIAVTVDGKIAKLYIDGKLTDTKSLFKNIPTISDSLIIGGDNRPYNSKHFKGTIYSVALFEDVRTAEEIRKDMLSVNADTESLLYAKSLATLKSSPSAIETGKTFGERDMITLKPLKSSPATIEAIIHIPTSFTGRAGVVFGNYDGSNRDQINLEIHENGKPRLHINNEGTANSYIFNVDVRSDFPIHIAVTFEGKTASLYMNGALAGTVKMYSNLPNATENFKVGGDNRLNNSQYFKGTIYALGVYGAARSAEQIFNDSVLMDDKSNDLVYLSYFNADLTDIEKNPAIGTTFTDENSVAIETLPSVPKTIEALIKISPDIYERQGVIVGNYDNSTGAQINLEIFYNGVVRLFYNMGTYRGNCMFYGVDVRSTEATHIAVTIDGKLASLYIDGVLAATDTLLIDLPEAVENFKVGGDNRDGNVQYFKGELFSLNMFSDVRTPEEIAEDYVAVNKNADSLIYSRDFTVTESTAPVVPEYRPAGQIYDGLSIDSIHVSSTPHTFEATISLPTTFEGRGGVIVGNYVGDASNQVNLEVHEGGCIRLFFVNNGQKVNGYFTTDIRSDTPVHIAVTVDGTLATLYVNGVATETVELATTLPDHTENYAVGNDYRTYNFQYFKGTIYSVSLFDDVRTPKEIAEDVAFICGNTDGLLYSELFARELCNPYSAGFTHDESEWIIDIHPTESENGLKHKECLTCGEITVQREISNTREEGKHVDYNTNDVLAPESEKDAVSIGTLSSAPLTFEAVIQLDPSYKNRAGVIMGSYDGSSADGLNIEIYTNGNPRLYYKVGGIGYSYLFTTDIRSEALTHIAITIDGMSARLYVNGEFAEEAALTVAAPDTFDFNVGNDKRPSGGQYFKGSIYSVALFEDVRTAEEIKLDSIFVADTTSGLLYSAYYTEKH